jgi:hypothetical protein
MASNLQSGKDKIKLLMEYESINQKVLETILQNAK